MGTLNHPENSIPGISPVPHLSPLGLAGELDLQALQEAPSDRLHSERRHHRHGDHAILLDFLTLVAL